MREEKEFGLVDQISEETFRRAEEMCAKLSSKLSLDKRGNAIFYNGAFTDLDSPSRREMSVTVAELEGQPWSTLIADVELPVTSQGLLVYKISPGHDRRYLGRIRVSRPGRRKDDSPFRHFAMFDIEREARR